ncbi:MAG TPA: hypothetical protein PKD05_08870 [Candidatus Melainabacteria bacterium]|nr:hypothetical protein [Candidatus Melainabacteria bacterium]
MKAYIITFIVVLCFTTVMAGSPNARSYKGVGVSEVNINDDAALPAAKQEGLVGELILVDMDRPHFGTGRVKDTAT